MGQGYKFSNRKKRKNIHNCRTPDLGKGRTKAEADVALCHPGPEHSERLKAELPHLLLTILAAKDDDDMNITQKCIFAWKFSSYNTDSLPFLTKA